MDNLRTNYNYGIISLNIYQRDNNWGSILQSWALQQVLKDLKINNKIVNYRPEKMKYNTARYPILFNFPFHIKRMLRFALNDIIDANSYIIRDNKFLRFIEEHFNLTEYCDKNSIKGLNVDGYIVGSDIVWHEHFWGGIEPVYFCELDGMREKYNIAYAPSMAVNCFSKPIEKILPSLLKNFQQISVREQSKKDYIQSFTDKEVSCVLDPTFLLDSEEYDKLVLPSLIDEQYVLVYCVSQNERLIKYATEYANVNKYKLVHIKCGPGKYLHLKNSVNFDSAGIEEWLTLIKNAKMVFTTSFHACIFSIIFRKEFFVTYGEYGKSKIKDLLESLGINNYCEDSAEYNYNREPIDYALVYTKLNIKKEESLKYLKNSLGIK